MESKANCTEINGKTSLDENSKSDISDLPSKRIKRNTDSKSPSEETDTKSDQQSSDEEAYVEIEECDDEDGNIEEINIVPIVEHPSTDDSAGESEDENEEKECETTITETTVVHLDKEQSSRS